MKDAQVRKRIRFVVMLWGGICGVIAVFYGLAARGIGIPCLFYKITGLQCPGCGSSRAVMALLRLDLREALRHNALFPLEWGYLAWVWIYACVRYIRTGRFSYAPKPAMMDWAVLGACVLWGIIRNLIH